MKNTKLILKSAIKSVAEDKEKYILNPKKDFTRNRIFSFEKIISLVINLNKDSLKNNLDDLQKKENNFGTESAFIQSRDKILPTAFHQVLRNIVNQVSFKNSSSKLKLLVIDGSSLQIPTNTMDKDSYIKDIRKKLRKLVQAITSYI